MFTRKYRQMNADLQRQLAAELIHDGPGYPMARVELDREAISPMPARTNSPPWGAPAARRSSANRIASFATAPTRNREDHRRFWERRGAANTFPAAASVTREGRPLWLEATYNPVRDGQGRLLKVVKYASDIDAIVHQEHEMQSKLDALSRSMAMIEFDLDGNVLAANDNFPRHHGLWPSRAGQRQPPSVLRTGLPRRPAVRRPLAPPEPRRVRHRAVPPGPPQRPAGLAGSQLQPGLRRRRQALQGGQVRQRCQRPHAPLPGRGGQRPPGPYPVHRDPHGRRTRRADHPERGGGNAQDREYPGCFLAEHRRTVTALATDHLDRQHHPARSPSRPTCSPSMPPSRPPAPATRVAASPWWPTRCGNWRNAPASRPRRSPT